MRSLGSLDTIGIAVELLGRVRDQQDSCTVCRTSLDTRGIAVESLGRVCGPAGKLWSL